MKAFRKGKRLLALALSVLLAVNGLPAVTFAEGQTTRSLCEHHQSHTADCGYREALPCGHEHTEDCYTSELTCGYDEAGEATVSDSDAGHTHTLQCHALDCPHQQGEHHDGCGYAESRPCKYICELCKEPAIDPEAKPEELTEPTACTLTGGCPLADGHEGGCAAESQDAEKETPCILTEGCSLPAGHEGGCATESQDAEKETPCILTEGCSLPAGHEGGCVPADSEKVTPCTLTEGCSLPAGHEGECVPEPPAADAGKITVTAFDKLDRPVRYAPLQTTWDGLGLPATLGASGYKAAGTDTTPQPEAISIEGVTWEVFERDGSPAAYEDDRPAPCLYWLRAVLPEGYALDESAALPELELRYGMALRGIPRAPTGDFIVTGDASQYEWNAPVLTIRSGAALTIQNITPQTPTTHRIKVASGAANVNITLAGVNIDVSDINAPGVGEQACAFDMTGAAVNLTLATGTSNILKSNTIYAGLQVPEGATLTVGGAGKLEAVGKPHGAGIGGGNRVNGGNITIKDSAQVTAASRHPDGGGGAGAGIGGGNGGNGGIITIQDSTQVTATSGTGAGIGGGGGGDNGGNGGNITIKGSAKVTATSSTGAGIGGSHLGNGDTITIQDSAQVAATSGTGAGIGGGYTNIGGSGGNGGAVKISGQNTHVTVKAESGKDIGSGWHGTDGGTLSVTGGAILEMQNGGTNAKNPEYKNCTLIDGGGNRIQYGNEGKAVPTLSLAAAPTGSLTLPGNVTLTATLSGSASGNAGKTITFTVNSTTHPATTDASGKATHTVTNPSAGTYTFGASFAGDTENKQAAATQISGYAVNPGAQAALTLGGLGNSYTYGDADITLSTSGGSGSGAVSYVSSEPAVASVTGDQVTIHKAGTFTITATKAADANYARAETSKAATVSPAAPNLELAATGGNTATVPIILTATVSKVGTGATPTGSVTFKEGETVLAANVALNGSGKAAHTVSRPAAGSHTYTAEYSGQSGYYSSAGATQTVGVGLAGQTGFAIRNPGVKTYGDGDFTLTATGGQSTGSVSFSVPSGNGVLTVAADGKVNITGAGKVTVTATKAGDSTYNQATAAREITVNRRDISHVAVDVTGSRVYTGSRLQPAFQVKDGTIAVTAGDYTSSYGPNVDAGADAGVITLTGQHNYTGTKTVAFDIDKRSLTSAVIMLEAEPYLYTGRPVKPAVTKVEVDGITVPPTAFEAAYANNTGAGTATVTITPRAGSNFSGSASATFEITENMNPSGSGSGGPSSDDGSGPEPQDSYKGTGDSISRSVSRSDLKRLADTGRSLTLGCGNAGMTFEPAALKAILAAVPASAGSITFAAAPADLSAFPDAAKRIGARPVYTFTVSCRDSQGHPVTIPVDFPAGSASISLSYAPAAAEAAGSLFMVYVDGRGAMTWLDNSSYDAGRVLAAVPHFSTYGVAYRTPVPVFTDVTDHWAKEDIEFAAARGLFSGTGNNRFSPDDAMTLGMFVTALGRLAGVDPDSFQTRSFTDVKAGAYYAPYAEWAVQKNLVKGTGGSLFSPDAPVTREQMAVMMADYAGQMGYSLPAPLAAAAYADKDKISAWAVKEAAAMQRAGIIKGKDGNRLDPQGNATRAEGSAVLRRFVEIVTDPAAAQGWEKNDSGHWLYYRSGRALTGWQTIGGLRYYFNADGVMHEGWKQDTGANKWYYWTSAGAAAGWQEIGGKRYYFDEKGAMAVNTRVDGYEIGPDGVRKEQ